MNSNSSTIENPSSRPVSSLPPLAGLPGVQEPQTPTTGPLVIPGDVLCVASDDGTTCLVHARPQNLCQAALDRLRVDHGPWRD